MAGNLYWISTVSYAVIMLLILFNDYRASEKPNAVERSYRRMANWVFFFCLQDTFWGLCDAHIIKGDLPFFIASSIFYLSTVISTIFWLSYVLRYLKVKQRNYRIALMINGLIISLQIFLVVMNCFRPVLFHIENGRYVTERLRPFAFMNQYIIYFLIGLVTLIYALKSKASKKKRYWTVFFFTLSPVLLGIFQLLYPQAPFYSLGYFFACFVVHIFVVAKDREMAYRGNIIESIAETFYSMHLIDLRSNTMERMIESEILTKLIGKETRADEMARIVFSATVSDAYKEMVLAFTDLTTLAERMSDANRISCEFVGVNYGWTRITIFSSERDENGTMIKAMLITQIIDDEKRKQIDLLYQSLNDELTGLYNRRAYENEMTAISERGMEDSLVFVSMDVNELKVVNDTLGHEAGDELLIGATNCMKNCFGPYGKIFRTGGDEFNAIINAGEIQLDYIRRDFENSIMDWRGRLVDHVSVSYGIVSKNEVPSGNIYEIAKLADTRMYESKSEYYKKKGVDRRGQRDAHVALCTLYTNILKINITDDTYQIVNMDANEQTEEKGFTNQISTWLAQFGVSGQVHPEDLENYLAKTNLEYMRNYFQSNNASLTVFYRRKYDEEYRHVMMEIIPANDYSAANQSLFLYVKSIEG